MKLDVDMADGTQHLRFHFIEALTRGEVSELGPEVVAGSRIRSEGLDIRCTGVFGRHTTWSQLTKPTSVRMRHDRAQLRHMRRLSHASFPLSTTWRGGQGVRSPPAGVHLPMGVGAQRVDPIQRSTIRPAEP